MKLIFLALIRDYKRYWGKATLTLVAFIFSLCLFLIIDLFLSLLKQNSSSLQEQSYTHTLVNSQGKIQRADLKILLEKKLILEWQPADKIQDIWTVNEESFSLTIQSHNHHQFFFETMKQDKDLQDKIQKEGIRKQIFLLKQSNQNKINMTNIFSQTLQKELSVIWIPIPKKIQSQALIDIAYFQKLFKRHHLDKIKVNLNKAESKALKQFLKDQNSPYKLRSLKEDKQNELSWLSSLESNLGFLSLLSLLVSFSLCFQCFQFIQHKRENLIQSMRYIFVSPRIIMAARFLECLLLASIACSIALILARFIAVHSLGLFSNFIQSFYFQFDAKIIKLNPVLITKAFSISIFACALSFISKKGNPPKLGSISLILLLILILAINVFIPSLGQTSHILIMALLMIILSLCFCLLLLPKIGSALKKISKQTLWRLKISAESFTHAWQHLAIITFVLALSLGLIFAMLLYVNSFKASVTQWLDFNIKHDVYIQHKDSTLSRSFPIHPSTLKELRKDIKIYPHQEIIRVKSQWNSLPLTLNFISNLEEDNHQNLKEGRLIKNAKTELYITEQFAIKHQKKLGDKLHFEGISDQTKQIVGILYDYSSEFPSAFLDINSYLGSKDIHGVAVTFSQDQEKQFQKLIQKNKKWQLSIQDKKGLKQQSIDIFNETFAFTWFIIILTSSLCFFSLLNLLTLIKEERRKEFETLKLIGANKNERLKILTLQVQLILIISSILGLFLGFSLYHIIVNGLQKLSFAWTLFLDIPAFSFLMILLSLFLISLGLCKLNHHENT